MPREFRSTMFIALLARLRHLDFTSITFKQPLTFYGSTPSFKMDVLYHIECIGLYRLVD